MTEWYNQLNYLEMGLIKDFAIDEFNKAKTDYDGKKVIACLHQSSDAKDFEIRLPQLIRRC